jgi:hypothetical protein
MDIASCCSISDSQGFNAIKQCSNIHSRPRESQEIEAVLTRQNDYSQEVLGVTNALVWIIYDSTCSLDIIAGAWGYTETGMQIIIDPTAKQLFFCKFILPA